MRPGRVLSAAMALGALTAAATVAQAQAREPRARVRVESADCRCVDKDGNEIENCTCFKSPDVAGMLARVMPFGESRPRLGITITEELNADDASKGARIQSVLDDGPADEAGLREDDIITAVDGKSLLTPLDRATERDFDLDGSMAVQRLMALIRDVEAGQDVRVDYLRDGDARSTTVKARELDGWGVRLAPTTWGREPGELGEALEGMQGRLRELRFEGREPRLFEYQVRPPTPPNGVRAPRSTEFFFGSSGDCPDSSHGDVVVSLYSARCVGGVALEELNPKLGSYFGTEEGVLVTDVGEDSTLGLEPGDVILKIGDRNVTDADRVRRILGSYGDEEAITMTIMRQKREMSVQGTLGR